MEYIYIELDATVNRREVRENNLLHQNNNNKKKANKTKNKIISL